MNESTRNKFISKRNEREKRKEKREKRKEREREKGAEPSGLREREREREVRAGARRYGNRRDKNNSARVRLPCNKETER